MALILLAGATVSAIQNYAADLSAAAWVWHRWTEYDALLNSGHERFDARELVRHKVREVVDRWKNG